MSQKDSQKISWKAPEYQRPSRKKNWYIATSIVVLVMLFFCFFAIQNWQIVALGYSSNFLFALIIIIAAAIMIFNERQPEIMVHFEVSDEGVKVGQKLYDYDSFKHFSIVYKPNDEIKNLYLEFKNTIRPRLSIPLMATDPLDLRDILLKNLEEDLDRAGPPLSEQLTKLLKL